MADRRSRRRRQRVRNSIIAGAVGVAVVVAGGTAWAMTRRTTVSYRTASVTRGPVTQSLLLTGTVAPSLQSTVTFPVSGTVAIVNVTVGRSVTAGQTLASLQTTALQDQVTQDNATVAAAELTLYQAQNGQATSASGNGSSGTTGSFPSGTTTHSGSTDSGSTSSSANSGKASANSAAIRSAQAMLLGTQRQVDAALARTRRDLAAADAACGTGKPTGSPTASPTSTPTTTPTPSPSGRPSGPPGSPGTTTCTTAEHTVLADESGVFGLQQSLSRQEAALNRLLGKSSSSSGGSSNSTSKTGSTATSSSTVVSAQQLAADQAAVDAAQAQLAVAQQNLAQATIVAPISGVVASVGVTVGQKATANSATSGIVIIGGDGHVVTTTVDVGTIPTVKLGQHATITADGSSTVHSGTVIAIGVGPTTTGGSDYAVTIGVTGSGTGLLNGASATVQLVTGQVVATISVPTSAVHSIGTLHFVTLLKNGQTSTVRVTVGAVGPLDTQVTGQLAVGDQVVLANLSEPLPTTTTTRIGGFGGAGFGGGGTFRRAAGTGATTTGG